MVGKLNTPNGLSPNLMHDTGTFSNNNGIFVIGDILTDILKQKWRGTEIIDRDGKETLDFFFIQILKRTLDAGVNFDKTRTQ